MGGYVIFAVAFSLLVAFLWLRWFRKKDKYEKEPERLIYLAFFAGALATIPSVLLESFLRLRDQGSTIILREPFPLLFMGGNRGGVFQISCRPPDGLSFKTI